MSGKDNGMVQETLTTSGEDIVQVLTSLANKRRLQMLTSLLKGVRTFHEFQEVTGLG